MEKVLRAEEAPRRVGLHAQEPVQAGGRVSTVSSCTSLWYNQGFTVYNTLSVNTISYSIVTKRSDA